MPTFVNGTSDVRVQQGYVGQRDICFDALRLVGALAIVCLHVSAPVVLMPKNGVHWWIGCLVNSYCRWAVPTFVMISGALLLSQPLSISPLSFWRRRATRVLVPLVVWSFFYTCWREWRAGHVDILSASRSFINGPSYYHLWFMYMIGGLYMATPVLRRLVARYPGPYVLLVALIGPVVVLISLSSSSVRGTVLGKWLMIEALFVGYFLAGYYLYTFYRRRILRVILLAAFLASGALTAMTAGRQTAIQASDIISSYLNPFTVTMSLAVFLYMVQKKQVPYRPFTWIEGEIARAAGLTLGMYCTAKRSTGVPCIL